MESTGSILRLLIVSFVTGMRMVRQKPTGEPQVLATFPGLRSCVQVRWLALTRTIAVGPNDKIYVSVGSSCNACEEKEEVRATVLEMDPDGRISVTTRAAYETCRLRWVDNQLFATNMGADHLGRDRPEDTMGSIREGKNYGWPYCFQLGSKMFVDPKLNPSASKFDCRKSLTYCGTGSSYSTLGLEHFDAAESTTLGGSF
jgi:glucose/arabinose dehydrogenase